jgi:superfamily II DNA/RNA helicase
VYAILAELRHAAQASKASDHSWAQQALVQYGLYKQFLSSPESCRKTVQRRIATVNASDPDSPDLPYLERLEAALGRLTMRDSSRYQLLIQQLQHIGWDGSTASPRLLVFTEYRDTQDALAAALTRDFHLHYSSKFEDQPVQVLATMHGSCPDVHLMKTVEAFGTGSSPIRMLLATDVASEGINLHHACHHIIHYDLPWSIITLIQRNGRIDRFGQTKNPVLRYLMVKTEQGLLQGDEAIFARLIAKVEEINHSTRQGETVLKLYDPEAEERYIAEAGLLAGNVNVLEQSASTARFETTELEAVLHQANPAHHEDFLQFLLGETNAPLLPPPRLTTADRHDCACTQTNAFSWRGIASCENRIRTIRRSKKRAISCSSRPRGTYGDDWGRLMNGAMWCLAPRRSRRKPGRRITNSG